MQNYGRLRARVHSSIQTAEAGLLVAVFCAHISMLAPQRSLPEHYPKVSARKKLPDCLLSDFFFHHFNWNRWFASLATTVIIIILYCTTLAKRRLLRRVRVKNRGGSVRVCVGVCMCVCVRVRTHMSGYMMYPDICVLQLFWGISMN